ncbi:hypothetical protein Pla175_06850 [Pirellulimonas nuda]|uniref:Transmembrane protein n=1 Tax=Pirellulimonas nuda TaxID=2528009 RepID=A0A518D7A3_9BACT|nr:hypothetical protein [Pirellulimonas nuda]QDU87326.1 hypothetical protein Pla175_06850 [Pirellulimonas nuda]
MPDPAAFNPYEAPQSAPSFPAELLPTAPPPDEEDIPIGALGWAMIYALTLFAAVMTFLCTSAAFAIAAFHSNNGALLAFGFCFALLAAIFVGYVVVGSFVGPLNRGGAEQSPSETAPDLPPREAD